MVFQAHQPSAAKTKVFRWSKVLKSLIPMTLKSELSSLQDQVARPTRENKHLNTLQAHADGEIKALAVFGARARFDEHNNNL